MRITRKLFLGLVLLPSGLYACGQWFGGSHSKGNQPLGFVNIPPPSGHSPNQAYANLPATSAAALADNELSRYGSCGDLIADIDARVATQLAINWNWAVYYYNERLAEEQSTKNSDIHPDTVDSVESVNSASGAVMSGAPAPAASASAPTSNGATTAGPSTVGTNLQVAGVDEGDQIKISDDAILVVDNQPTTNVLNIAVIGLNPLTYHTTIAIPGLQNAELYTVGTRLIVTGTSYAVASSANNINSSGAWGTNYTVTVYDLSDLEKPEQLSSQTFDGDIVDSRMVNGILVMVLNSAFNYPGQLPRPTDVQLLAGFAAFLANFNASMQSHLTGAKLGGVNCTDYLKIPGSNVTLSMQHVVSYDTEKGTTLAEVAIPGSDSSLYMTEQTIYSIGQFGDQFSNQATDSTVFAPGSPTLPTAPSTSTAMTAANEQLVIKAITFDATTGKLTPNAIGTVPGHLKEFDPSWAFHEMTTSGGTALAVVTTTGDVRDQTGNDTAANQLIVLMPDSPASTTSTAISDNPNANAVRELKPVATLTGFGAAEDVRAVRYANDQAYIVTFKRTDPLFVIDLTNPLAPTISGQLQIPGFSMYLQPDGTNRLIGLGYEAEDSGEPDINRAFFQGLLLQLFDVSDPKNPTRLSFLDLGMRGSYSEANQNHHAFYYDEANKLVAMPVALFGDAPTNTTTAPTPSALATPNAPGTPQGLNGQLVHTFREYSGAIFYAIDATQLTEKKRVSHFDLLDPNCQGQILPLTSWTTPIARDPEVSRIFRQGNTIYTVSNFGVKTLDATSFADLATVAIPGRTCQIPVPRGGNE